MNLVLKGFRVVFHVKFPHLQKAKRSNVFAGHVIRVSRLSLAWYVTTSNILSIRPIRLLGGIFLFDCNLNKNIRFRTYILSVLNILKVIKNTSL